METINMEARKVLFNKEQYDAFDKLIHTYQSDDPNLVYRIVDGTFTNDFAPLNDVDLHKLLQAYYFGYKIYLTPLEKIQQEIDSVVEGHLPLNPEIEFGSDRDINYYLRGLETARDLLTGEQPIPEQAPKEQELKFVNTSTTRNTITGVFNIPGPLYRADLVAINMENGTYDIIKNKYTVDKGVVLEQVMRNLLDQAHSPIVLSIYYLGKDNKGHAIYH